LQFFPKNRKKIFYHRGHRELLIILCAALCSLWFIFLSSGQPYTAQAQQSPPTPDPRFGTIEAYYAADQADAALVGWERIIFYWSEIERNGPDDWNWFHAPNERINDEIARGREVVGLIAHTPKWATDGIEGAGVPRGLYLPIHDPSNYWAQYIRYLITVYGDRVHHWIIWNEPDIPLDTFGAQWQGSNADYYQLVKVAYLVAHEVQPDVVIHLGGLTYWHNSNYLNEFLTAASTDPTAAANGYYFDVVSAHIYFKPETTMIIAGSLQDTLHKFGLEKPIWINETNAPPYDDPAQLWDKPVFKVTQDDQASYLLQEFALALSMSVERIGVYKWVDEPAPDPGFEPYGLLRHDRSTRPAFEAFKVITTHYAETEEAVRYERPEMWTVILNRGAKTTRVFWARGTSPTVAVVPALAGSAVRVDQTGTARDVYPVLGYYVLWLDAASCTNGSECLMGGHPVLLVEEASADFNRPETLRPRLDTDLTPKKRVALGAVGLFVLAAGITGASIIRRRQARKVDR